MRLKRQEEAETSTDRLPMLLTAIDVADLLRTSRNAVYAMVERDQLPGVTRIGRRLRFRSDALLDWLNERRAPSPEGDRR
jgi:excisionase family DNA binding protein